MKRFLYIWLIVVITWSILSRADDPSPVIAPNYVQLSDGVNAVSSTTTPGGLGLNTHCTNCGDLTSATITAINTGFASNGVLLGQVNTSIVSNTASTSAAIGTAATSISTTINNGTSQTVGAINANTATTSATAISIIAAINSGTTIINNQIVSASVSNTTIVSAGTTSIVTAVNNNSASNTAITSSTATAIISAINAAITSSTGTFRRINQREFYDSETAQFDIPSNLSSGTIYVGLAPQGSNTASAVWSIVRTPFSSESIPLSQQYRSGVSWTGRTLGVWQ